MYALFTNHPHVRVELYDTEDEAHQALKLLFIEVYGNSGGAFNQAERDIYAATSNELIAETVQTYCDPQDWMCVTTVKDNRK